MENENVRPQEPQRSKRPPPMPAESGSGSDKHSAPENLKTDEDILDKTVEDSFPASDPPSRTPVVGP